MREGGCTHAETGKKRQDCGTCICTFPSAAANANTVILFSGGSRDRMLMDQYLQALCLHLRESAGRAQQYEVDSIYFGGGTPTFFGADGLKRILAEIYKRYDVTRNAEISLEANPDSVTAKDLAALPPCGLQPSPSGCSPTRTSFSRLWAAPTPTPRQCRPSPRPRGRI